MLQGKKTYLIVTAMVIVNVLKQSGVVIDGVTDDDMVIAVNVCLGILASLTNYIGRKRERQTQPD